MKVHYALVDPATEWDNNDYWSDPICGLKETESPLSDNPKYITCKKCLKKLTHANT